MQVRTGNKDFTIKQTADGIEYESRELKTVKNVFRVEKKEKTEDGYIITTVSGNVYELFNEWGEEFDEDDLKTIRKGSVAGYVDSSEKGFFVCGYSSDFIESEIKKYFSEENEGAEEAEEETLGESHEQTVIETDCPHCKTHIEEVVITGQDDEIICTKCGESIEITFYESMYDYVQNADLSYYEIADGKIRETPFVEEIKPCDDPGFHLVADVMEHEGNWYVHVNFGENETSYLLESALYDTVYLRYIEQSYGVYVAENGRVYETEEEAKAV